MTELILLLSGAAGIAFAHTILGPDHYLPFVALGRARSWSRMRLVAVTTACGAGHVLSSVALGVVGIVAGVALARIDVIQGFRGDVAAWALTAFGFVYLAWGIRHAMRKREHVHPHAHDDGELHVHEHSHEGAHLHVHGKPEKVTPWVMFTIFLFGPCEPLIPLLMLPAARGEWGMVVLVTAVFAVTTVATMLAAVLALTLGIERIPIGSMGRFAHAAAGATIVFCGAGIALLGL